MKHTVTIPFEFDTSAIEQRIEQDGFDAAMNELLSQVKKSILATLPRKRQTDYYSSGTPKTFNDVNWYQYIGQHFDGWMSEHSQEVVDEAAMLLAQKASRKAKWREVLKELKKEDVDG